MPEKPDTTHCPTCRRQVRSGIACRQGSCPFFRRLGHAGMLVLDRPLKQHWQ